MDADYESEKLVSSIRSVQIESGKETTIVPADGSRQIDLKLTSTGELVFISNRADLKGALELWSADLIGGIYQLSRDGESKRHAVLIPAAAS